MDMEELATEAKVKTTQAKVKTTEAKVGTTEAKVPDKVSGVLYCISHPIWFCLLGVFWCVFLAAGNQ
jgi:hypothetical protein